MLTLFVTSFANSFFDVHLLPIFETTLSGVHEFSDYVIRNSIFLAIEQTGRFGLAVVSWFAEFLFGWSIEFPNFEIPYWASELSVISTIILHAQTRAMRYATPASSLTMAERERVEWEWALLNSNKLLRIVQHACWVLVLVVYRVKKLVELPFRLLGVERIAKWFGIAVGGSLFLGFFYLFHDLAAVPATKHLTSQLAIAHRSFVYWTIFCLFAAVVASLGFILWNGLMLPA